jgi:uncharacterized membrane protein
MKANNRKVIKMTELALLTAIIVLMAFTPIGYIKTLGIEITLIVIPVTVGAIVLGSTGGVVLGAVFGITSFIQCFGYSHFGAALLGISPGLTFILCMVPRILMGWITGFIFDALKKIDKTKGISYAAASLAGPILNTILFMGVLVWFFYDTDYIQAFVTQLGAKNVFAFIIGFVGINGLVEAGVCLVLGTAISKVLDILYGRGKDFA